MALTLYLAMTGAEMQNCSTPPAHTAWMACHFSPYSSGLSNVPQVLMPGSMLILNDRIPPQGHGPALVAEQLAQAAAQLEVTRVLLDFQRTEDPLTAKIAEVVVKACPCPVGVTPGYAEGLDCPVFVTPQLRKELKEQLDAWPGRPVWLEAAWDCEQVDITAKGAVCSPAPLPREVSVFHTAEELHCRYYLELEDTCARFTVWREQEQLQSLLAEAQALGIDCAVGLYQQLGKNSAPQPAGASS